MIPFNRIAGRLFLLLFLSLWLPAALQSQNIPSLPVLSPPVDTISGLFKWDFDLVGTWKFTPRVEPDDHLRSFNEADKLKNIMVPGEWHMLGNKVAIDNEAGYYKNFPVPETWAGMSVKVRFDGVYSEATVYVNGKEAGEIKSPFTAYEFYITDLLEYGTMNMLFLKVRSTSLADSLSNASYYAAHPLGGINRNVTLFVMPACHLTELHVSTRFDSNYQDAWVLIESGVTNTSDRRMHVIEDYRLIDNKGALEYLGTATDRRIRLEAGETRVYRDSFLISEPAKWDPEHPELYRISVRLLVNGAPVMWSSRRFGFRQIEVRGNRLFVNNMPVKLRGVNRHEVHPYAGRVINEAVMNMDLVLFKQANINYIRTSHYPPSTEFLDRCDEFGFFVESEAPFCWAHRAMFFENGAPKGVDYILKPERRFDAIVLPTLQMVNNHRSHPSVLMWSLGNESPLYEEYFRESARAVKQLDPGRPLIFSQSRPGDDLNELEIANHHYPGPGGPDLYRNSDRPVVFDEYAHLNAYNRRELVTDPGLRDYWGELAAPMWEKMYQAEGVLGGAIWAGIDDAFLEYGRNPVGYGTWGIIDIWRRPKPEFWHVKKMYSPVRISKIQDPSQKNGKLLLRFENRHDFTNMNECLISWESGNISGKLDPDIPPRSTGEALIELPDGHKANELYVQVTDPRGIEVQRTRIKLDQKLPARVKRKSSGKPSLSYQESGQVLTIATKGSSLLLDRETGLVEIMSGVDTMLLASPHLMILPLNEEGGGTQMRGAYLEPEAFTGTANGWKAGEIRIEKKKKKYCFFHVSGEYEEAEGSFTYTLDKEGMLEIGYDFVLKQDVSPRQVGLVFDLPGSFGTLYWDRKGFWTVYPPTHIGREAGVATTHMDIPASLLPGPTDPAQTDWENERNSLGSNDFRATRTRIRLAGLEDNNGNSVEIHSDGSQSVRAWHEDGRVRILVADYVNGGAERFNKASRELEHVTWEKGKRITGTVRIKPNLQGI